MGIIKPSPAEKARMAELEQAINHLGSIIVPGGTDPDDVPEWRAANARVAAMEKSLNPLHRAIARERTR